MLRLMLLRHAKSDWDDPGLADFDRPLARRGRNAAPLVGRYMAEHDLSPDQIICSTALRAKETLALVLPHLTGGIDITLTDALYERHTDGDYLDIITRQGGAARTLMLVGHNPATEDTALALAGGGDAEALRELRLKYPTAALAVIDVEAGNWADIAPGSGRLERFVTPRALGGHEDAA